MDVTEKNWSSGRALRLGRRFFTFSRETLTYARIDENQIRRQVRVFRNQVVTRLDCRKSRRRVSRKVSMEKKKIKIITTICLKTELFYSSEWNTITNETVHWLVVDCRVLVVGRVVASDRGAQRTLYDGGGGGAKVPHRRDGAHTAVHVITYTRAPPPPPTVWILTVISARQNGCSLLYDTHSIPSSYGFFYLLFFSLLGISSVCFFFFFSPAVLISRYNGLFFRLVDPGGIALSRFLAFVCVCVWGGRRELRKTCANL